MRAFWLLSFLAISLLATSAQGADEGLSPLAAALAQVRTTHGVNELRDAGPELTPIKHLLRAWVEAQLPPVPEATSPDAPVELPSPRAYDLLSQRLNKALGEAQLTCSEETTPADRCAGREPGDEDSRGYLGDVHISPVEDGRYLLVVTGVGVRCGSDQSAYLYAHGPDHRWRLLFQSEQDNYGKDQYEAQEFLSIDVSPSDVAWNEPAPPPLILTLGFNPWCSSNWHVLFSRLWRATESASTPAPLLDHTDELYVGDDAVASARLLQNDLLVEFRGRSIDSGTLIRSHVTHYRINAGDNLERIAPVALSPSDFVEEWLTSDWRDAVRWIDPGADSSVGRKSHKALKADFEDADGPPKQCRSNPSLWQVGFSREDTEHADRSGPESYYLVRWIAPYRFSLVRIGTRAFPGCDQTVAMPDDISTLFPLQGWTP